MRSSGILLHVTALPNAHGVGDLGQAARDFVDLLASARQSWWQVLPLGPTGYADSPYQCLSAFAGNPLLISPVELVQLGLVSEAEVRPPAFPLDHVDYAAVAEYKAGISFLAWQRFAGRAPPALRAEWEEYRQREASWLDEYGVFRSTKANFGEGSWQDWPEPLRCRDAQALKRARTEFAREVDLHCFRQFLFFQQWEALRRYAEERGVRIVGDIPIFVALDSSDVWSRPELFLLDESRRPTFVAGVPPDYFARTGQRWGNPLYRWEAHAATGFRWWIDRLRATFAQVHQVRLDHFRGFEACWSVPADCPTAERGEWVKVPGNALFQAAAAALPSLPIIAEDLGLITPEVDALRRDLGFPGMRVLQFAYGGAREGRFLPHRFEPHTVVYSGTHDNDTTLGWYQKLTPDEVAYFRRHHPPSEGDPPVWQVIRAAWSSVAKLAVIPLQDLLQLDNSARFNYPGTADGNWRWRVTHEALHGPHWQRLRDLTELYDR